MKKYLLRTVGLVALVGATAFASYFPATEAIADDGVDGQYQTLAAKKRPYKGPKDTFDLNGDGKVDLAVPTAQCNESVFMPAICWEDVPRDIKYRPRYESCGGDAAILLGGKFSSSYSVVLRDRANRDRFPPCVSNGANYNGCSFNECDTLGLNRCSAWKCQRTLNERIGRKRFKVCCLGDSGDSAVMSKTTRLTIKLRDVPGSNTDPLIRAHLKRNNPRLRLN
jgi:hypothetical protein